MIKKTITFEDLEGNKITEEFHFHLGKADIAEMELSKKGGLTEYAKKISAEEDSQKLYALVKELLSRCVGKRSEDGVEFIRSEALTNRFMNSDAYSEFFVELSTNHESLIAFFNGVVPVSMQAEVAAANASLAAQGTETVELPATSDVEEPSWLKEGRTPTPEEVKNATPEQLQMAFQRKLSTPSADSIA